MADAATDDRARLRKRVERWASRLEVAPRSVRIRPMVRKWGSCSEGGIITLADDLTNRPHDFQDFVIVHELLHLRIPNHGRLFKALMTVHLKSWRAQSVLRSV